MAIKKLYRQNDRQGHGYRYYENTAVGEKTDADTQREKKNRLNTTQSYTDRQMACVLFLPVQPPKAWVPAQQIFFITRCKNYTITIITQQQHL